jgi:pyrroline-5-carboxylate reductase
MGGALLAGWVKGAVEGNAICVVEPRASEAVAALCASRGIRLKARFEDYDTMPAPQVAVLAVKPQILDDAIRPLVGHLVADTLVISIAAGRRLDSLRGVLGETRAIVRAMPNLPAMTGAGMTAAFAGAYVNAAMRSLTERLLRAVGEMLWLAREEDIDAATAISGSGPAYVFYLVECLVEAGKAEGLDPAIAEQLARVTASGAGRLLAEGGSNAGALRVAVSSPGGTTEAALGVLMSEKEGLAQLIRRAVQAARLRARALSR